MRAFLFATFRQYSLGDDRTKAALKKPKCKQACLTVNSFHSPFMYGFHDCSVHVRLDGAC